MKGLTFTEAKETYLDLAPVAVLRNHKTGTASIPIITEWIEFWFDKKEERDELHNNLLTGRRSMVDRVEGKYRFGCTVHKC